jgi:hypothetical protein
MVLTRPPAPNTLLVTLRRLQIRQHRRDRLNIRRPRRDDQGKRRAHRGRGRWCLEHGKRGVFELQGLLLEAAFHELLRIAGQKSARWGQCCCGRRRRQRSTTSSVSKRFRSCFIGLEAPSQLVDELYGRILATLQMTLGTEEPQQTVRMVTACGNSRKGADGRSP